MNIIIPSLDRACQLQLLIHSLQSNWSLDNIKLKILYKTSSKAYEEGYRRLKWNYRNDPIIFVSETDFCSQIKYWINEGKSKNVGFMVDDGVLFRRPNIHSLEIEDVLQNNQVITFSLRLSPETRLQNYLTGELQPELHYKEIYNNIITWRWNRYPKGTNFNYIYSWDSHFYSKEWLYNLITNKNFEGPRALEHQLSVSSELYDNNKPLMASCKQSSYIVNTVNCVQPGGPDAGVFYPYSIEELNQKFLDGEQISLSSFDDFVAEGCHTEIPIKWERNN